MEIVANPSKRASHLLPLAFCFAGALLPSCFGQSPDGANPAAPPAGAPPGNPPQSYSQPFQKFGVALSAGSLGAGIEAATTVTRRSNLRLGFNYFTYSLSGTRSDNLSYDGTLRVSSAEVLWDQYLAGPLHVSVGALIYDGFQGTGNLHVPSGKSLTLNNVTYYSAPSDPVTGTGLLSSSKAAPVALFGFGNLLPRSARHFTANFDLGVAFQGSPNAKLNLLGSVCPSPNVGCAPIRAQPSVQANVTAEQTKINNDLAPFKFYPILRLSFGYQF